MRKLIKTDKTRQFPILFNINKIILQFFSLFSNSCEIPLQKYAGTYRYDMYLSCSHADTRFICHVHVCTEIRKIIFISSQDKKYTSYAGYMDKIIHRLFS
jgi:hypothetical protein